MWRRPISTLRPGATPRRIEWVTARATPNVPPKARKRFRTAISFADPARYPARTTATVSRAAIPPPRTRSRGRRGVGASPRRQTCRTSAATSPTVAVPAAAASERVRRRRLACFAGRFIDARRRRGERGRQRSMPTSLPAVPNGHARATARRSGRLLVGVPAAHDRLAGFVAGRAEDRMELEGGGVAAGRRLAPERLGHGADVVRPAAAADADVVDAGLARAERELRHLEARALEGLELDGERPPAVLAAQRLERGGRRRRPVRHRLGRDRDVHGRADALEQRQHRLRSAGAVEADDPRAVAGQDAARLDVVEAVVRRLRLHARERHHRRQAELRADVEGDQRLADVVERLGDHEVDALLDGPAELLLVLRAHDEPGPDRVRGVEGPRVADVAGDEGVALARDLVRDPDGLAVQVLELARAPDVLQLLAVRVVGERDHDVRPGAEELAV